MFSAYNSAAPLQERKHQLEQITTKLESLYGLTRKELAKYIIPTSSVPDDLQIDLLIHTLNLYTKHLTNTEVLTFINTELAQNQKLATLLVSNPDKATNIIIGKLLATDKAIDPQSTKQQVVTLLSNLT